MVDTVHGKDKFLLFRKYKDANVKGASKLALQTSHELSFENDNEVRQTKDGGKVVKGATTYTLNITAISSRDEVNIMLEEAAENNERIEVWEVDYGAGKNEEGKYKSRYLQGYLNNWGLPADADETTELETEVIVEGTPQKGYVTLSEEHENQIMYAHRDLDPVNEPVED